MLNEAKPQEAEAAARPELIGAGTV